MRIGGCACGSMSCQFCGVGYSFRPYYVPSVEYKPFPNPADLERRILSLELRISELHRKIDSLRIKDDEENRPSN